MESNWLKIISTKLRNLIGCRPCGPCKLNQEIWLVLDYVCDLCVTSIKKSDWLKIMWFYIADFGTEATGRISLVTASTTLVLCTGWTWSASGSWRQGTGWGDSTRLSLRCVCTCVWVWFTYNSLSPLTPPLSFPFPSLSPLPFLPFPFSPSLSPLPSVPLSFLPRTRTPSPIWTKTSQTTWSTRYRSTPSLRSGSGVRRGAVTRPRNTQRPSTWWEGEMGKKLGASSRV